MNKTMISSRLFLSLVWAALLVAPSLIELTSCDDAHQEIPKTFNYATYVQKYGKSYDNVETLSRAKLFYARTLGILKANMLYIAHKANYFLKQNQYTDMTTREMEQSLVAKDVDLIPVVGSDLYPDAPADQFAEGFDKDDINDGYSRADANEVTAQKSPVNFFSDEDDQKVDPRELVREILEHSDDAKKLSKALELDNSASIGSATDKYKTENKIEHKLMVAPENKNYDPSLIPSFAWSDDVDRATDTFASYMMEDFMGHLEPYPRPSIPSGRVLPYDPSKKPGTGMLSELIGSVRTFYDYFSKENDVVVVDSNKDELEKEIANESKGNDAPKDDVKAPEKEVIFDIDWRRTGCISQPKHQWKCNACYAFATLDLMEFFYCRQKKTSTEFSVQYIIDCGQKSELNGCKGGKLSNVGLFIQKYGLQLGASYPYDALEHECPYDEKSDQEQKSWAFKPLISGWRMFPEIEAWYKWLPKSPIIVGINMPSDFLAYGGGIHDGSDCTPGMVHAMLLVGSGKENGKPFWLLKNTFNSDWGEAGYFRLSKRAPIKCFSSAIVARVKFNE